MYCYLYIIDWMIVNLYLRTNGHDIRSWLAGTGPQWNIVPGIIYYCINETILSCCPNCSIILYCQISLSLLTRRPPLIKIVISLLPFLSLSISLSLSLSVLLARILREGHEMKITLKKLCVTHFKDCATLS